MDVVLNKKGWHYPQQRIISLWGDVKPTFDGTAAAGAACSSAPTPVEAIEYWLANLVPTNYELDDFQVRTPTDIIGQHIHLVKFDVTSSDGAGNGYNYEDGTFSHQEVVRPDRRSRASDGGLFATDGATRECPSRPRNFPTFIRTPRAGSWARRRPSSAGTPIR